MTGASASGAQIRLNDCLFIVHLDRIWRKPRILANIRRISYIQHVHLVRPTCYWLHYNIHEFKNILLLLLGSALFSGLLSINTARIFSKYF